MGEKFVELICNKCGKENKQKTEGFVILTDEEKFNEVYIQEPFICKHCGAFDTYKMDIFNKIGVIARVAMATKSGADDISDIIMKRFGSVEGKEVIYAEFMKKYEDDLEKNPDDVATLLGYANLLSNTKDREAANEYYKRVVELDNMAVEAMISIMEYEYRKKNIVRAKIFAEKALKVIEDGKYYKTNDIERFKFDFEILYEIIMNEKSRSNIGLNEKCPCGSGKKYKKCCAQKYN